MEEEIRQQLDRLAELQAHRDVVLLEKQSLIDEVLTPEIRARLAEIDEEFSDKIAAINAEAEALEAEIKQGVIGHGATVKGVHLQAVYARGRYSYSETPKAGYEPCSVYRRLGEPSVTIRKS